MKKLCAGILLLALMLSLSVPFAAAEEIVAKPYYVLGWSDYNHERFPYMDGLVTSGINTVGENVRFYIKPTDDEYYGVVYGNYTDADVTAFAEGLKRLMNARPEGMRYWHLWGPGKALALQPQSVIYLDYGVDQMKELMYAIVKKYHEIGGLMDGIVIDTEYTGMGSWYIYSRDAAKDPLIYHKIVSDPHYATEVRPLLVERGFEFYPNPSENTPEIFTISNSLGDKYAQSRAVWDTVMGLRLKGYLNEWCFEPMIQYFPNATLSDYQSTDMKPWLKSVNDAGNVGGQAGSSLRGGNTSNYNFYANRPSSEFFQDSQKLPIFKNPPSYTEAVYEMSPYNMFLYDMNLAKRMYASTDTKNVSFWICEYDYEKKEKNTVSNTPYYTEEILHLALLDPQPFLGYLYDQAFKDESGKVSKEVYEDRCLVINEIMAELTRVAGYADRNPIEVPQNWNNEFVLSGMYCGGRNLWRITPNTDIVSTADFQVAGADPTFRVAGQTVSFPGGKIVADGPISVVGTCGFWVETAANVTPIVTNDADRLVNKAAFLENFESYAPGTKVVTTNVRDEGGWIIQPKGNDLVVESVGGTQVLAITGNSIFRNQLIPANVTLGDSYAMRQVWELTVTVPAGMTAEESFVFLDFESEKRVKDGGIKISGGKAYYSENKEYKEFSLDLSAGGKYLFRREMNLEKNTCTYTIVDAAGTVAAKAENVAIPASNGKIQYIGVACQKVAGKVLLDNFTLRSAGIGADFETYDAKTGLKLAEETVNPAATAYRLSWTNVDAAEKTATVMAAFYEGDTLKEEKLIQELKMAPGCDGVETGIVEVPEGQSVKVYVKTNIGEADSENPTAPTEPNHGDGKSSNNIGLIAVIAAAVLADAGVAAALLLTRKKTGKETK